MNSNQPAPDSYSEGSDRQMIDTLERETFEYFMTERNPENGLIRDKTEKDSPASVAAVGMALSAFPVGVERGYVGRAEAAKRAIQILDFFCRAPQGPEVNATGYKGFYYHFLKMETGERAWECELSTIDTAIFIAGALTAAGYFDAHSPEEARLRELAQELYERVDWAWALNGGATLTHGWKPESGFLNHRWDNGYSEAHILYVLALGSPTHAIPESGYRAWTSTFELRTYYGLSYIYAGPLFIHQMSHLWIDFRNIRDEANQRFNIDYFENSRRATLAQQRYAIENPQGFRHYGEHFWGFTASSGPGPARRVIDGKERIFYDYVARGAPGDIDDGTISPWAAVSSVAFAPEIVIDTIRHLAEKHRLKHSSLYGFEASFNPTFREATPVNQGWVSNCRFGLNEGPVIGMIENYKTQLIWRIMKRCPAIKIGLQRAGFVNVAGPELQNPCDSAY